MNNNAINYSKSICFNSICNNALEVQSKEFNHNLLIGINRLISKIYTKSKGLWGMSSSNEVYIALLQKLCLLLGASDFAAIQQLRLQAQQQACSRCRVVFFTQEVSCWPSLESLYNVMSADARFETRLVYVPYLHVNADTSVDNFAIYTEKLHLPAIHSSNYNLSEDSPDVAIFVKPYDIWIPDKFFSTEVDSIVERMIYISYGMEQSRHASEYEFAQFLEYRAWKHIVYGNIVKEEAFLFGYKHSENVAVWGHPRVDWYLGKSSKPSSILALANGRKVLMWNTSHIVDAVNSTGTFLKWKDVIFNYFKDNNDAFLLWRPHPLLFGNLINSNIITNDELNDLFNNLAKYNNIYIDRSQDYREAFMASDALLTDINSTFSVEYILTEKPMLFLPNNIHESFLDNVCADAIAVASSSEDIIDFINGVLVVTDNKAQQRKLLKYKLFYFPPNGISVAENICNNVIDNINDEIKMVYGGADGYEIYF